MLRKEAPLPIPESDPSARPNTEAAKPGELGRLRISRPHLRLMPPRLVFLEAPERSVAAERDEPA
jgi:hypothetical protein